MKKYFISISLTGFGSNRQIWRIQGPHRTTIKTRRYRCYGIILMFTMIQGCMVIPLLVILNFKNYSMVDFFTVRATYLIMFLKNSKNLKKLEKSQKSFVHRKLLPNMPPIPTRGTTKIGYTEFGATKQVRPWCSDSSVTIRTITNTWADR